jgi:hypothetical protein
MKYENYAIFFILIIQKNVPIGLRLKKSGSTLLLKMLKEQKHNQMAGFGNGPK